MNSNQRKLHELLLKELDHQRSDVKTKEFKIIHYFNEPDEEVIVTYFFKDFMEDFSIKYDWRLNRRLMDRITQKIKELIDDSSK